MPQSGGGSRAADAAPAGGRPVPALVRRLRGRPGAEAEERDTRSGSPFTSLGVAPFRLHLRAEPSPLIVHSFVSDRWIFGYGSLIWRPGFPHREARVAGVHGWVRRFWQGSHDHRGVPGAPGRVVTLTPDRRGYVEGLAFRLDGEAADGVFEALDHREKNGYRRADVVLRFRGGGTAEGRVYVAPADNDAFLGPAPLEEMAAQVLASAGPSGANRDYILRLADALREHGIHDRHVFELERRVRDAASDGR